VPPAQPASTTVGPLAASQAPLVWGVYPYGGVVLASDMRSGLWVLRVRRAAARQPAGGRLPGGRGDGRVPVLLGAAAAAALAAGVLGLARSRRRRTA
jgi:hypothetical protein